MFYGRGIVVKPASMGHLEFLQEKMNKSKSGTQKVLLLFHECNETESSISYKQAVIFHTSTLGGHTSDSYNLMYFYKLNMSECTLHKYKINSYLSKWKKEMENIQKKCCRRRRNLNCTLSVPFAMSEGIRFGMSETKRNPSNKWRSFFKYCRFPALSTDI